MPDFKGDISKLFFCNCKWLVFRHSILHFLRLQSQCLETPMSSRWHSSLKSLTFECQDADIRMSAKWLSKGLFLTVYNQKTFNGILTFLSSMNFALILRSFSRKIVVFLQTARNVFLWICPIKKQTPQNCWEGFWGVWALFMVGFYCLSSNLIGILNCTLTGLPRCEPGIHLGIIFSTRTTSAPQP